MQIPFRANLSAPEFPFLTELQGQTVIVPGQDQNYIPYVATRKDTDQDRDFPQLLFAENVMPTLRGYRSAGIRGMIYNVNSVNSLDKLVHTVVHSSTVGTGKPVHALVEANGDVYHNAIPGVPGFPSEWNLHTVGVFDSQAQDIYTAYINGLTYLTSNSGSTATNRMVKYDGITYAAVTPSGVTMSAIDGNTASSGYHILWDTNTIYWSAVNDPEDFVPSLVTGAGSAKIQDAEGDIMLCVPINLGFLIYCRGNVVAALYSNNTRFPFNFKRVNNSGGFLAREYISGGNSLAYHYSWTTSGLQRITVQSAETVLPEVIDFLTSKKYETINAATFQLTTVDVPNSLTRKFRIVADRYLVVSYGTVPITAGGYYTHALVLDLVTERWGKLKVDHHDVYDNHDISAQDEDMAMFSIGFLALDMSTYVADFRMSNLNAESVILLGKYQFQRNNFLRLEQVAVECVDSADAFTCDDVVSLDGKTLQPKVSGYLAHNAPKLRMFSFHKEGFNHVLAFKGKFNIVSLELKFVQTSRIR